MDEAGVLVEDLEKLVWMNLSGDIVSSEAELFGEKVRQILKQHPEYIMFADEARNSNMNVKDHSCIGEERLLKAREQMAAEIVIVATFEAHFTVLRLTACTDAWRPMTHSCACQTHVRQSSDPMHASRCD